MSDQRSSSSGTIAQLSAKMMDAQVYFQMVVKQELQVLVASGLEREVAVKMLLRRIVQSTYEPEESDVKRVMRQFQMIHDDAVRALIVKQEIGRLKRQGLDAFAAIELLTKKMQGISVPSEERDEEEKDGESNEEPVHDAMSDHCLSPVDEEKKQCGEADSSTVNAEMTESPRIEGAEENEKTKNEETTNELQLPEKSSPHSGAADSDEIVEGTEAEMESSAVPSQDPTSSVTSLSLCERIDQVSISAASSEASLCDHAATPVASPALSTAHTTPRTAFALFSAHSRKRRVTSGASSPVNDVEDAPVSPRMSVTMASPSSSHRPHFGMSRPRSPTFRFPKSKKQKIWSDDENNEPLMDTISLKEASIPPPVSPTGVGIASETPPSSVTATPTKVGKRRRAIRGGSSSPELDEIDVEDPMVRVSKRHKL